MAVSRTLSSMPPPKPKSPPPEYPDLYGKRRELAKVQLLDRQIGFLQEELKYVEGLQPASRCIKEVADFAMANSDPLIPTSRKIRRSCRFWKWLCGKSCFNMSWICCCWYPHLEIPSCCKNCNLHCCHSCCSCRIPNCNCFSCPRFRFLKKILCCRNCLPSTKCKCSFLECPNLSRCSCCIVNCCYPPCCLC